MTDERKQEQQRLRALEFLNDRRLQAELLGAHKQLAARRLREKKVKDTLCGPYGRFFNEGTD
jgi:hypothetical protein